MIANYLWWCINQIISTIFCSISISIFRNQLHFGSLSISLVIINAWFFNSSEPWLYSHKFITAIFIKPKIFIILILCLLLNGCLFFYYRNWNLFCLLVMIAISLWLFLWYLLNCLWFFLFLFIVSNNLPHYYCSIISTNRQ